MIGNNVLETPSAMSFSRISAVSLFQSVVVIRLKKAIKAADRAFLFCIQPYRIFTCDCVFNGH